MKYKNLIPKQLFINTWLSGTDHGFANGYVAVTKEHPWYKKHYNEINIHIHGGLTFSKFITDDHVKKGFSVEFLGLWCVGFDTCHYNDNQTNSDYTFCLNELNKLHSKAKKALNRKIRQHEKNSDI